MFVDYGNVEDVKIENIRWLSPDTAQYPAQAFNCGLCGVEPLQVTNSNQFLKCITLQQDK